ncbi:hypothetical protein BJV74DRAFT_578534 [Russula compacta]|nr:hypothetical protein BJV74DRAFT_578534 [Russula compacta]
MERRRPDVLYLMQSWRDQKMPWTPGRRIMFEHKFHFLGGERVNAGMTAALEPFGRAINYFAVLFLDFPFETGQKPPEYRTMRPTDIGFFTDSRVRLPGEVYRLQWVINRVFGAHIMRLCATPAYWPKKSESSADSCVGSGASYDPTSTDMRGYSQRY